MREPETNTCPCRGGSAHSFLRRAACKVGQSMIALPFAIRSIVPVRSGPNRDGRRKHTWGRETGYKVASSSAGGTACYSELFVGTSGLKFSLWFLNFPGVSVRFGKGPPRVQRAVRTLAIPPASAVEGIDGGFPQYRLHFFGYARS